MDKAYAKTETGMSSEEKREMLKDFKVGEVSGKNVSSSFRDLEGVPTAITHHAAPMTEIVTKIREQLIQ